MEEILLNQAKYPTNNVLHIILSPVFYPEKNLSLENSKLDIDERFYVGICFLRLEKNNFSVPW